MATIKWLFDIIVTHIQSFNPEHNDVSQFSVNAAFNNKQVAITSSRINVTDFQNDRTLEFDATIKRLQKNLIECGMPIVVKYGSTILGTARMAFPAMVTDRLDEEMEDIMHVDSCNVELNGERTGYLEVLLRLCVKCIPKKEEITENANVGQSINPQDILFVVGESQRCPSPCDPCLDALEPEVGDERLKLDLQRYRSGQDRVMDSDIMSSPAAKGACCELKKMAQEYEKIIDSITKGTSQPLPLKQPCRGTEPPQSPIASFPIAPTKHPEAYLPKFSVAPEKVVKDAGKQSSEELAIANLNPIRFCPICLTNMSWLPKLSACPKCGAKPMPVTEKVKQPPPTADEIILQYLGKPLKSAEDFCVDPCKKALQGGDDDPDCPKCRCTCKFGKMCAHCRIRKMCREIFNNAKKQDPTCPKVLPKSSEDFCVAEDEETNCRPFLARVFSELRDMYDVKDTVKVPEKTIIDNGPSGSKKKKEDKDVADASKLLNNKDDIKYAQICNNVVTSQKKCGHKNCVNQEGAVSKRHGWAWTSSREARKYGWRPGAIRKPIKKLMRFFLSSATQRNATAICGEINEIEKKKEQELPILNVMKKNGEIFITLRGIPSSKFDMKPIVFRVVKSELAVALREIKQNLKDMGFSKCTCHKTVMMCVCRHYIEKKQLEQALNKECERRSMPSCVDHLVLTDTSDSEVEFNCDVTPPAAFQGLPIATKTRTVNHGTQIEKKDFQPIPPKYPVKMSPYWRTFDCAVGDRYTGTSFGLPGEVVFEDGAFGFFGGGPHGASVCPGGRKKPAGIWGDSPGGPMKGMKLGGPGGGSFPKGFPGGGKTGPFAIPGKEGTGKPIPVRMPAKYYKDLEEKAKKEEEARLAEIEKNKRGTDMADYMKKHPSKSASAVGPDGLTDAARKRKQLMQQPVPPLDGLKKRGKPCLCDCAFCPCSSPPPRPCPPCDPCCPSPPVRCCFVPCTPLPFKC